MAKTKSENVTSYLTQNLAVVLFRMGITENPTLNFLHNDSGIYKLFSDKFLGNDEFMRRIPLVGGDLSLMILAAHHFGAGVYTIFNQIRYRKPASDFNQREVATILKELNDTDAYELCLKVLRVEPESHNKQSIDRLLQISLAIYKDSCGNSNLFDKDLLEAYTKVLFNLGVTFALNC